MANYGADSVFDVPNISKGKVIVDLKRARETTAKNRELLRDLNSIIEDEFEAIRRGSGDKNKFFGVFITTIIGAFGFILMEQSENEETRALYKDLTEVVSKHLLSAKDYSPRDYRIFMSKVKALPRAIYLHNMILSCLDVYTVEITTAFDKLHIK